MKIKKNKSVSRTTTDRENPSWTAQDFRNAKRFDQLPKAMQERLMAVSKRGRPRKASPKKQISLRLDAGLVDHLKHSAGYNVRIESMLLKAWAAHRI